MKFILLFVIVLISVYTMSCKNQDISIPKDALLVDVRTEKEFSEGSVPNSINIPLSTIEENIDKFKGLRKTEFKCYKACNILKQAEKNEMSYYLNSFFQAIRNKKKFEQLFIVASD